MVKRTSLPTFRHAVPTLSIQLSDLAFGAPGSGVLKCHGSHTGFDETGTDGINPNVSIAQLVRRGLRQAVHTVLEYQRFGIVLNIPTTYAALLALSIKHVAFST